MLLLPRPPLPINVFSGLKSARTTSQKTHIANRAWLTKVHQLLLLCELPFAVLQSSDQRDSSSSCATDTQRDRERQVSSNVTPPCWRRCDGRTKPCYAATSIVKFSRNFARESRSTTLAVAPELNNKGSQLIPLPRVLLRHQQAPSELHTHALPEPSTWHQEPDSKIPQSHAGTVRGLSSTLNIPSVCTELLFFGELAPTSHTSSSIHGPLLPVASALDRRRMWWTDTGFFDVPGMVGVAAASCVSLIGAMLMFRRQKVVRDQRACFGRIEQAGFQR